MNKTSSSPLFPKKERHHQPKRQDEEATKSRQNKSKGDKGIYVEGRWSNLGVPPWRWAAAAVQCLRRRKKKPDRGEREREVVRGWVGYSETDIRPPWRRIHPSSLLKCAVLSTSKTCMAHLTQSRARLNEPPPKGGRGGGNGI